LVSALSYGAVLGLLQGRREGFRLGLAIGLVTALAVGLAVGLLLSIAPDRIAAGALFAPHEFVVVVLAMNLAIALVRLRVLQPWNLRWAGTLAVGGTNGALVTGIAILHAVLGGADLTLGFFFVVIRGVLLGAAVGAVTAPVADYLAFWLRPRFRVFIALAPYLKEIWVPLSGFTFGYISLIFLFASVIGAVWRADPAGAYHGMAPNSGFGAFFYLSVQTITGLGFSGVTPNSTYAKGLASIEVIIGILWDTVFVATFIAYLQPRFQRLVSLRDDASQPERHR
jgi:hypothetical protein